MVKEVMNQVIGEVKGDSHLEGLLELEYQG